MKYLPLGNRVSITNILYKINEIFPHWIFMYGGSYLMELKNPQIIYRDYKDCVKTFATINDLPELTEFTGQPEFICRGRLNRGDLCHLVKMNEQIVNVVWLLRGKFYVRGQGLKYETPKDFLYLYNGETAHNARMKGIMNLALAHITEYAHTLGCANFIGLIEEKNKYSFKYHERLKFQKIAIIKFFKIFGVKINIFKQIGNKSRINIHLVFPKEYKFI